MRFRKKNTLANSPAGEATVDARKVAILRATIAARIKHGTTLAEIAQQFNDTAFAEIILLDTQSRLAVA